MAKQVTLKNPDAPASEAQTGAIFRFTGLDVRPMKMTAGQASEVLSGLINISKTGMKSKEIRTRIRKLWAKDIASGKIIDRTKDSDKKKGTKPASDNALFNQLSGKTSNNAESESPEMV